MVHILGGMELRPLGFDYFCVIICFLAVDFLSEYRFRPWLLTGLLNGLLAQGELQYFGKLSAGCVAGAILVKYGSLCVPSITSPDINVALTLIFTPCVVSLILLALASVSSPDGNTSKQ